MAKEQIEAACKELGLVMTTEFVPFSKSRNTQPKEDGKVWRSLNWKVTLAKRELRRRDEEGSDYTPRPILTTEYSQGEAHCPAYKDRQHGLPGFMSISRDKAVASEVETGRIYVSAFQGGGTRKIAEPELTDVIHSLCMDADALDYSTYEEWADNFGYDTDSRKGEATYKACLAIALKLRNGIGEAGLARLREACQDY